MDSTGWVIVIFLVALGIAAVLAYAAWQRRRTTSLQQRFGPEYDHTVAESGGRRPGETELLQREKEHAQLQLRPLPTESMQRYKTEWASIQQQFVDDPDDAVTRADDLAGRVMAELGYPTESFEGGAAQVSVDHPEVVQRYRAAHGVRSESGDEATTEQLRRALTSYRSLIDELLTDGQQRDSS
ncbi:hypothetical protein BH18ACT8_BH18ACT8_15940 [soil metagenome]